MGASFIPTKSRNHVEGEAQEVTTFQKWGTKSFTPSCGGGAAQKVLDRDLFPFCSSPGADPGGGVLGVRTAPPPLLGDPQTS